MAQTYDNTKPIDGLPGVGTAFSDLYTIIRNHNDAHRSSFSGTAFPTSPVPVAGQFCWRTDLGLLYVYTGAAWKEIGVEDLSFLAELENARGTKPTLDQRFDVAFNEDGTLKASTSLNPSQWHLPSLSFTYIAASQFRVNGDQTDIYKASRRLKINLTASTVYSEVVSAAYSDPNTTITIYDAVLDSGLVSVEHSLFLPTANSGALTLRMLSGTGIQNTEGWTDFGTAGTNWTKLDTVSYYKDPMGAVHLRGTIYVASGTGSTTVFSAANGLASGYRPAQSFRHLSTQNLSSGVCSFIVVSTDGSISSTILYSTNTYIFLDGITFKAA